MILTKRLINCPGNSRDDLSTVMNILNLIGSIVFLVSAILAFFVPAPTIPEGGMPTTNERTMNST